MFSQAGDKDNGGIKTVDQPTAQVSPAVGGFNSSCMNALLANDNTLQIYIMSHNASFNHMLIYSIGNDYTWTVVTPMVNSTQYPGLASNGTGVGGTCYLYQIDITGLGMTTIRLGVIPNGYSIIKGLSNTVLTPTMEDSNVNMLTSNLSPDPRFDLSAINDACENMPLLTNNPNICLPGSVVSGVMMDSRCGYLPGTSHLIYNALKATLPGDGEAFGDQPVMIGTLYMTEDLQFRGANGFSERPSYADFDFNDFSFYVTISNATSFLVAPFELGIPNPL